MWVSNAVRDDVNKAVHVFYVNQETVKYWNSKRKVGEPLVFTGWYWAKGETEGGPFKSRSSCYRDAWYIMVLKMTPPPLYRDAHKLEVAEARRKLRENNRKVG